MTKEEEKEVIRVCGERYEESDVPTFIRKKDSQRIPNSLKAGRKEGREIFNGMLDEAGIDLKAAKKEENPYLDYEIEELEGLLENPNDIETGCELNCDMCLEEEKKLIVQAIDEIKIEKSKEEGSYWNP